MAKKISGKLVYLHGGITTANVDLTDGHGLSDVEFQQDGEPIEVPTQGDLMQWAEASHEGLGISFSILSDAKKPGDTHTPVIDPIFFRGAGKERKYEFALARGSGLPKFAADAIHGSIGISFPNDNLTRYTVEVKFNTFTAAGNQA